MSPARVFSALVLSLILLCCHSAFQVLATAAVSSSSCVGGWLPDLALLTGDGGTVVTSVGRQPQLYHVDALGHTLSSVPLFYNFGGPTQLVLTPTADGVWVKSSYGSLFSSYPAVYLYSLPSLSLLVNLTASHFSPPPSTTLNFPNWLLAVDSTGRLYVSDASAVWMFDASGGRVSQVGYFSLTYQGPLYYLRLTVCPTVSGDEVMWVWGQNNNRVPIKMVAIALHLNGSLIRAQTLDDPGFQGMRSPPLVSCYANTGTLTMGVLGYGQMGFVALNGSSWLRSISLPPVETNLRPTQGAVNVLYSADKLILYSFTMAAVYLYDPVSLTLVGSISSEVAALPGAQEVIAMADGSFVVNVDSSFSVASRVSPEGRTLVKYGVYVHNVTSEVAYRHTLATHPTTGLTFIAETIISSRSSTWSRQFTSDGRYQSSFVTPYSVFLNPLFDPVSGLLWGAGFSLRQGGRSDVSGGRPFQRWGSGVSVHHSAPACPAVQLRLRLQPLDNQLDHAAVDDKGGQWDCSRTTPPCTRSTSRANSCGTCRSSTVLDRRRWRTTASGVKSSRCVALSRRVRGS